MSRTVGVVIPSIRPDADLLESYLHELEAQLDPETIRIELDEPTDETVDRLEDAPGTVHAADLLAYADALGYRLEEVPVNWEDSSESTVSSLGTNIELASGLLSTRHRVKQLRGDRVHTAIPAQLSAPEPVIETFGTGTIR